MRSDWQTWVALGIVAVAAVLLVRAAWRRRNHHEGCGCPGAQNAGEWHTLKKQLRKRR